MFLTSTGIVFSPDLLTRWVRPYVEAAGLQKNERSPLLMVTMAATFRDWTSTTTPKSNPFL